LYAVHVNHGLRSRSTIEQKFVKNLCNKYKIPLYTKKYYSTFLKGESMEMWARRVRQSTYLSAKEKFNCDYILTAHHANDLVETILMHLDGGCGIEGLRGIPKNNQNLIRPLLSYKKSEIKEYIKRKKLNFVSDESNNDIRIKRNFVRHQILKPWVNQTEDVIEKFLELSEKANHATDRMIIAITQIAKSTIIKNGLIIIPNKITKVLSKNHFVRLIKELVKESNISWRRNKWKSLIQWVGTSKTGSTYFINNKWTILRNRDHFILNNKLYKSVEKKINNEGEVDSDCIQLKIKKTDGFTKNDNPMYETIDGELIANKKLLLRSWKDGDQYKPLGMSGHKKVSDLLIDNKVDRFSKNNQLVLTADGEIIWVCGQSISDQVKVTNNTTNFLELSFEHTYNNAS
jgi:tRNA(Ile)-lysidine synthase